MEILDFERKADIQSRIREKLTGAGPAPVQKPKPEAGKEPVKAK